MPSKPLTNEELIGTVNIWEAHKRSRVESASALKMSCNTLSSRLTEARTRGLIAPKRIADYQLQTTYFPRLPLSCENGYVIIGSDAHYWPGHLSTAHKAFLKIIREFKPKIVIMNGDVLDVATASRHAPIGWEKPPALVDEIEECKTRLLEIKDAAGNAKRIWTLGNHDMRFESRLALQAPQYAKIHGVSLKDQFYDWIHCWSTWINGEVVVKHRFKGGIHATHNNTLWAGKSIFTGHLHSLKVTPFNDYNPQTRYGVDTGTLAPLHPEPGAQFLYTEDSPLNWRSGFAVLTFWRGELLFPELVHVMDQKRFQFRGRVYFV